MRHQYVCLFHEVKPSNTAFSINNMSNYGFSYVLSGNATLVDANGNSHTLTSGSFFQLDPQRFYQLYVDKTSHWRECSIAMNQDCAQAHLQLQSIRPIERSYHIGIHQHIIQAYIDCFQLIAREPKVRLSEIVHSVLHCLHFIYQEINKQIDNDPFISEAQHMLRASINKRLCLDAIAQDMNMNYHAFRRKFKQLSGISPGDWLIRERIQQAQHLLRRLSIDDCSEALGYADRFTFSRQFKKVTGLAPHQYIKQIIQLHQ